MPFANNVKRAASLLLSAGAMALAACNQQETVRLTTGTGGGTGSGTSSAGGMDPSGAGAGSPASNGASSSTGLVLQGTGPTTGAGGPCDYPTYGYGRGPGEIVDIELGWQGFVDQSTTESTIYASDLLDCDGSKGINAILVLEAGTWCETCQHDASMLDDELSSTWASLGIRVVTLMVQDASTNPATTDTALAWKNTYHLDSSIVAADPMFSFSPGGTVGLPYALVIDPRTMRIMVTRQGLPTPTDEVVALAKKNQP